MTRRTLLAGNYSHLVLNHQFNISWSQICCNEVKCCMNLQEVSTYKLPLKLLGIPVAALLPKSHSPSSLFLKFDLCPFGTWRSEAEGWASPLLSFSSVPSVSSFPPTPVSSPNPWDTGKVKEGHTTQTHGQLCVHLRRPMARSYQNLYSG